jgi:predicted dehydrogenase
MSLTRRTFLATTGAAAALGAVRTSWAQGNEADNKDAADIRVAVVGTNGQGRGHMGALRNNLVAICDVDEKVLAERAEWFAEESGRKLETFTDYRKLLERQDIDAVSIATPNHTHVLIAIAAIQAGKDVYVEKPVSHDIWEGRQLVAAARHHNKVVQCGTQSRSSPSLQKAVAWVRDGGLGEIRYAIGTCYKPRESIGKLTEPLQIPGTIDYDLWCGPAEKQELYRPRLHYDWHWDFNTGNGDMGNQGIHQMDIARWFLGEDSLAPRVLSIGGRLGYDDAGNTPNTQIVYLAYPKAPLLFETRGLPRSEAAQARWGRSMDAYRGASIGVIVQCERGHVLVPSYTEAVAYDLDGREVEHWRGGGRHHDNWLAAVAAHDPQLLNCEIREGHLSSSLCHLGGVSHQLGEPKRAGEIAETIAADDLLSNSFDRMASHLRANGVNIDGGRRSGGDSINLLTMGPWLELDTTTEQFTNNDEANALSARRGRKPFEIPEIERMAKTAAAAG